MCFIVKGARGAYRQDLKGLQRSSIQCDGLAVAGCCRWIWR